MNLLYLKRRMSDWGETSFKPALAPLLTAAALAFCCGANAQTSTWNFSGEADWNVATYWNPNGVPNGSLIQAIDQLAGSIIDLSGSDNITVQSLQDSGGLNIQNGTLTASTISVGGPFTLNGGTINNATITATSTLNLGSGTDTLSGVTLNGPSLTQTSGGSTWIESSSLTTPTYNLDNNAQILFEGTNAYNVTNTTFGTSGGGNNRIYLYNGNVTLPLGDTISGSLYAVANYSGSNTFTNNGTIDLNAASQNTQLSVTAFQNNGALNLTNGNVVTDSTSFTNAGTVSIAAGSDFYVPGGCTLTNSGTFTVATGGLLELNNSTLTGSLAFNNGTLQIDSGGATFSGATVNVPLVTQTSGGSAWIESSSLTTPTYNLDNNAQILFEGTNAYNVTNTTFGTSGGGNNRIYLYNGNFTLPLGDTISGSLYAVANYSGSNTFTNNGTMNLDANGMTTNLQPTAFQNNGQFNISNGNNVNNYATFDNAGSMSVAQGCIFTLSAGAITQTAGSIVVDGQAVMQNGSTLTVNAGSLSGSGTVSGNVYNAGKTAPGDAGSTGTLTVTGNMNQTASSETDIRIGGTTPGAQFDVLDVQGTATFGGTLVVNFIGGYVPAIGTQYDIIDYGSRGSSEFSSVLFENAPTGMRYSYLDGVNVLMVDRTLVTPGPESLPMFALGFLGLGAAVRARRRR